MPPSTSSFPPLSHPPRLLPPIQGSRLIVYHQTFHESDGTYNSLLPLLTNNTGITHVIVAALHLNDEPGNITLNDHKPEDARFNQLWAEVKWLQAAGIKVLGMLGGAAKGTYEKLSGDDESFESYYLPLRATIQAHKFSGIDLDIEEPTSLSTATRLIARLRADFGSTFLITMAPVATALLPDPNIPPHLRPPRPMLTTGPTPNPLHPTLPHLSGFSYAELECGPYGREIAWYNTQFYCGWGNAGTTDWYDAIVAAGWPPSKIVLGVVTNPHNGAGFVPVRQLQETCMRLRARYAMSGGRGFGGIMGWEYFNAGDHEEDLVHVAGLVMGNETAQAGWAAALGRVLRIENPPEPPEQDTPPVAGSGLAAITPEQIRQMLTKKADTMAAAPASSTTSTRPTWTEEKVTSLVTLGFSRQEAVAALDATGGEVELAAGFLFEHYPG